MATSFRQRVSAIVRTATGRTQDRRSGFGGYGGSGGLASGGLYNKKTGAGTLVDNTEDALFTPTRYWWRSPLEILYVQSSAAAKFVDLPVDDMFIRWRTWTADDEAAAEKMEEVEERHQVTERIAGAMKAARAFGTGVMVLMTKEAPMDTPLVPERIREGDLQAIRVFDRYDMSVNERIFDMFSPHFNSPEFYYLHPSRSQALPMRVHHSRILRFDGIRPPTDSWWYNYDDDWGLSKLIPVITSLIEDQSLATAIAHMSQEASIPVLGVADMREIVAGRAGQREASVEQIGDTINRLKSIYRILMLDKDREEFSRVAIQFAGLADLLDKFSERLAAAADIPITRWKGMSPAGMNATGESDMHNYIAMLEANREKMLASVLPVLDEILARDAGLDEPPEYDWNSLLEIDEAAQATTAKTKAEALAIGLTSVAIDEDEMREALNGDPVFGELHGEAPEPPEPEFDPMMGGGPPPAGGGGGGKPPGKPPAPKNNGGANNGKPKPKPG